MRFHTRLITALSLGVAIAACQGAPATVDEALARDLQAVNASSLELVSAGSATQIVSEIEQIPKAPEAAPARAPTKAPVARQTPRPQPRVTAAPAPRPVQRAPVPQPEPANEVATESTVPVAATPRPTSQPQGAGPAPPGGWRSVDEVIRNSRIPIKP